MSLLSVDNVVKKYSHHLALDGVSLDISEGSIFGLLGPNGAGKTSLIRIINQITGPDSGEVRFRGELLNSKDITRIGYLPEERGLYKKMKVGDQAIYLARLKGLSRSDARAKLKFWFDKFDILPWWNKKVEELSKGMQQKIQFVVTVLHEPELLIFDEPFSGFDPINAALLKKEILELSRKGSTIIFSTHNMASVEELCSTIALINSAKIILNGDVSAIKQQYKDHKLKLELVGDASALSNVLPHGFKIEQLNESASSFEVFIKNELDGDCNLLLRNVLDYYSILAFHEVLPGMDEVFIKAVNQANNVSTKIDEPI